MNLIRILEEEIVAKAKSIYAATKRPAGWADVRIAATGIL